MSLEGIRYIDNAYNTGLKVISIREVDRYSALFLEKEITFVLGD